MNKINTHKLGLAVAILVGGGHLLWSLLVAGGWAQALINFKLRMHFLEMPINVAGFDLGTAILLVLVATAFGYAFGRIIGAVCNWVNK